MYINTYIQNILKRVQMTICKAKIETEVESGHMDTAGVGESGADWGSSTAIYVLLCVKQLAGSSARHSVTTQRGHTYTLPSLYLLAPHCLFGFLLRRGCRVVPCGAWTLQLWHTGLLALRHVV